MAALCSALLVLHSAACAADALPLLDAPGPGYREQSARVRKPVEPPTVEPISFMYPFMGPPPVFDGEAPDQPLPLRRGEFRLLDEGAGWNFPVHQAPSIPFPAEEDAHPSADVTAESQDAVRLPVIPEVILPAPKDVGEANESAQPFAEHLPLELRAR